MGNFKKWWKNHWDEVMLITGFVVAGYFFARGMGWI